MTIFKRSSALFFTAFFISFLSTSFAFGDIGMVPSSGSPSCGAIQDGQDLCGTAPATFESNAIGTCPIGTFADIGRWGCYTCPEGFDRGIAAVDSDRACTRERVDDQLARFVSAKQVGTACPNGSFFDLVSGNCWSCPSGYVRSAAPINWADACVILPKEVFKPAAEHGLANGTNCPPPTVTVVNGVVVVSDPQFWDGIDGRCHSCPAGYTRTGYSVHDSKACSMVVSGKISRATVKGQGVCGDGEITDFLINPEQGGNCYTCPAGYDRTVFSVTSNQACETTPEIEFSLATKTTDLTCPVNQIFDFISTRHPDVKNKLLADGVSSDDYDVNDLGTCWSCPPGATRSWSSVTASDACVLADVGWNMPVYHHVGLFGLNGATQVVLDIINDKDHIIQLAQGYASTTTELSEEDFTQEVWQEISQNPEQSSILALAALARLQSFADRDDLQSYEREFLEDFQQQVTNYRSAMAQEALNILTVWQEGAFLRYVDPRFNNRPDVVLQKLFWLSIGVVSPPVSPPDFSALIYEYENIPEVDLIVLGMTAAEQSIDHDTLTTLMPNDLVGDLAQLAKDKLKDTLISSSEKAIMEAIKLQIQLKALDSGAKASAKMIITGPSTLGPQIAVALFIEYATQWGEFISGSIDAEPKLQANLAQAQQMYSVSRQLATEEGSLDLRHHYKTIMNSSIAPSAANQLLIEQAVTAHGDFTLTFLATAGGTVDTSTLPVVEGGSSSIVTATPNAGFRFVNWTDELGAIVSNTPALIVTQVVASQTYHANFSIDDILTDGSCGDSHQVAVISVPKIALCTAGLASSVIGNGPWSWNCNGSNGGSTTACSAPLKDVIKPVVTAPLSISINATSAAGTGANDAMLTGFFASASAVDNVDGQMTVTNNAPTTLPLGATVVVFVATDSSGNTASKQSIVSVIDGAPVIQAPADLIINASSLLSPVSLGNATASDAVDGVLIATADQSGPFSTGVHHITWTVTDSNGKSSSAIQTLKVQPLANFALEQRVANNNTTSIEVSVFLNGPAAAYPVSIPFTVGGSASLSDHTLTSGHVVINSGTLGSIMFDLVGISSEMAGKTIDLTMAATGLSNAVIGAQNTHRITINQLNAAVQPAKVTLTVEQNLVAANSIAIMDNGNIVATANVQAEQSTGIQPQVNFDWSKSDAQLVDIDSTDNTFTFDPSILNPGVYQIAVSVMNVDDISLVSTGVINLLIQSSAPVLSDSVDSDGDGINDADESYGDADNDGIPDYLDGIGELNVISEIRGNNKAFLLETQAGLTLRLGSIALGSGASQVFAAEVASLTESTEDSVMNVGGMFDYEVSDLANDGQSIKVVIAQLEPLPTNAVYRQFNAGLWTSFSEDDFNHLASAAGSEGNCPPPNNIAYTAGLTAGHWCVQLTISDGGPNDTDGSSNRRVVNLGGVGSMLLVSEPETETPIETEKENPTKKSGGPLSIWLLGLLMMLVAFSRVDKNRRQEAQSIA